MNRLIFMALMLSSCTTQPTKEECREMYTKEQVICGRYVEWFIDRDYNDE